MDVETTQIPRNIPSKTPSKMGFLKSKNGKCQRPGPVGRNPYLNFLREFRKRNCGLSAVETIRRGAKEWKTLPKEKKLQYIEAAKAARANPRRSVAKPSRNDLRCETQEMSSESEEDEEILFVPQKKNKKKMRKNKKTKASKETLWMQEKKKAKKLQTLNTGWNCRL